jgi:hypothetical protein
MENNKEIDSIVEKFIGDLGENFNTLKYVYNKEFIPGE